MVTNTLEFTIPVKTVSELNQREHWSTRAARLKAHKEISIIFTLNALNNSNFCFIPSYQKIRLFLCRNGKRKMDLDNLAGSFKGVIDGICHALKIDDRDIDMNFSQTIKNKEFTISVKVRVI